MVRAAGIEPALLAERDFESDATTDSILAFPYLGFRVKIGFLENCHLRGKMCNDLCKSQLIVKLVRS